MGTVIINKCRCNKKSERVYHAKNMVLYTYYINLYIYIYTQLLQKQKHNLNAIQKSTNREIFAIFAILFCKSAAHG